MADTTTPNILLTNQEAGGNDNTWGDIADANFERLDDVLGDTTSITTTGGNTVLTNNQELVAIIEIAGTLVSASNIVFTGRGGVWVIKNGTSGSYSLTCKVSGQTGVQIGQNDTKIVYCNGTDISLANPEAPVSSEVTVASASTCNVLGAGSEFVAVSGTATITSLGTGATRKRFVRATGAFTLTHNATSLILPGGKNITAASGDTFIVISDASSNCRVYGYQRASGQSLVSTKPIGEVSWYLGTTAPANHLFLNGQSIGNADSDATARASNSADTATLFALLWNSFSNTELPITDSAGNLAFRGASAAADFGDDKRLPLPDARERAIFGLGTMGGLSSPSRLTGLSGGINGSTMGATGGAQTHTLTTAESPSHTHTVTVTDPGHTHSYTRGNVYSGWADSEDNDIANPNLSSSTQTTGSSTTGISVSIASAGGGGAHNNTQPTIVTNYIIKT